MPESKSSLNIIDSVKEMKALIEKREKEIEDLDKKSYRSRHTKDWSGDKWKGEVINHYKEIHKNFKVLKSLNHSISIEIINPVETPYFR